MAVAIWGNVLLGLCCIVLGRKRILVSGLLLGWFLLSACLFVLGFAFFGHDFDPPAYVDWIGWVWLTAGIGIFGFLFRVLISNRSSATNENHH